MPPNRKRPIHTVAPTATASDTGDEINHAALPIVPPAPLGAPAKAPVFRPLKIYAYGPALGRARGNIRTINVRYEALAPGPVGERIAVVDYDATRNCFYDPVDLDDPMVAINGGLDPSESDPHFHQQMVYAISSESLRRVEVALSRTLEWRSPESCTPLRLVLYPHASVMTNAYSLPDGKIFLGYFRAEANATGRTIPGQTIFACLSHDVIVHNVAHVIISAVRPDLVSNSSMDNTAFQEALADLTPLLFHFNNRESVFDTIQRTAGAIYRSQLDAEHDPRGAPRIIAELTSNNPLLAVSQDFGEAIGQPSGIRNAIREPDPTALEHTTEPHERGAIVVAAVCDALFSIYQQRSVDLFRIFRAGGDHFDGKDVPEPLANRLSDEIERVASRVFNMCWRAIDYCPAVTMGLGDFLRACITADFEYTRDDSWGLREAMMQAFRRRGIKPSNGSFFSEDSLRWPIVEEGVFKQSTIDPTSPAALRAFVKDNLRALGFTAKARLDIYPIQVARLTAPDDTPQRTMSTQVIQRGKKPSGVTMVFDATGKLRYAIPSSRL